jgi:hypothetical protein
MKAISNLIAGEEVAPVTVAIATHNRAHLIADALKSCRDQTQRPERVIVVDDGSSDNTSEVVGQFDSLNITYVNVGKIGLGHARNLATALCTTKYLCILDDDDIMLPDRIRDHMRSFATGVQLSHGGWINFNSRGELEYKPGKVVGEDVIVYFGAAITHGACCYETAILREFPYRADLVGGADFDLAARIIRSGIKCAHTESYVLLRRRHQVSLSGMQSRGQESMRHVVVSMINHVRSDSEIESRRAIGASHGETMIDSPPLDQIYGTLGGLREAMQVVASVPRQAAELFTLMDRLRLDWPQLEVIDVETGLTATISLACRPTKSLAVLSAFDRALRRCAIKPVVSVAGAMPRSIMLSINVETPPSSFRLVLKSFVLRELHLAHRILVQQRLWEWYIAVRQETVRSRQRPAYYLVSAPFRKRDTPVQQRSYVESLRTFIHEQTDLSATTIEEGSSDDRGAGIV